jgi:hypothetical protein
VEESIVMKNEKRAIASGCVGTATFHLVQGQE